MSAQYRGIDKSSKKDLSLNGWLPAFENDVAVKCIAFLRKQMNENLGFNEHISAKLKEYILISKQLTPQYFTNSFESETDWKSNNLTYLDYFWLIVASLCVVTGDGTTALPLISEKIELNQALEKKENKDLSIEYREGNATIKVLDAANDNKPKMIIMADLMQCKTIITFKDTAQAKRCRFCQIKLTDKNRVNWLELAEKQKKKEAENEKKEENETKLLAQIYTEL